MPRRMGTRRQCMCTPCQDCLLPCQSSVSGCHAQAGRLLLLRCAVRRLSSRCAPLARRRPLHARPAADGFAVSIRRRLVHTAVKCGGGGAPARRSRCGTPRPGACPPPPAGRRRASSARALRGAPRGRLSVGAPLGLGLVIGLRYRVRVHLLCGRSRACSAAGTVCHPGAFARAASHRPGAPRQSRAQRPAAAARCCKGTRPHPSAAVRLPAPGATQSSMR
jgi:hypothetical protein